MKNLYLGVVSFFIFLSCANQQEFKSISTLDLKELLSKKSLQLVDVRTPEEIEKGSIQSAVFINYFDDDFLQKATKKLDKTRPVYVYCRSGNRSGKASTLLIKKGFQVINVLGGYNQWSKEN